MQELCSIEGWGRQKAVFMRPFRFMQSDTEGARRFCPKSKFCEKRRQVRPKFCDAPKALSGTML